MKVTGYIPMKPHLLKYIRYREGLAENKPMLIPDDNVISMYLDSLLTNKNAVREDKRHTMTSYKAKLPIRFSNRAIKWNDIFFSATRVQNFNNYVHKLLVDDLVNRIIVSKKLGQQEKETINKFIFEADLYEITFSALQKASQRHRKRKKTILFYPRNWHSIAQ